jgi:hypothetical protein
MAGIGGKLKISNPYFCHQVDRYEGVVHDRGTDKMFTLWRDVNTLRARLLLLLLCISDSVWAG